MEEQLIYERGQRREASEFAQSYKLRKRFGLTPTQLALLYLLYDAYPRPLSVGYINDNLQKCSAVERSDKIVDVYVSKIRKRLQAYTPDQVIDAYYGGWRILTKSGFYLINQIVSDVRTVTQKPVFVAREQHR